MALLQDFLSKCSEKNEGLDGCVCVCKARSHVGLEAPKIPQLAQREISVGIFCDPQGWH